MRNLIAFLLMAAAAWSQVAAPIDWYPGNWMNNEIKLKLGSASLVKFSYTGTIEFQGQSFPVTARRASESAPLEGEFTSNGARFRFTATLDGNRLRFVTDGTTYVLGREAAASANPSSNPLLRPMGTAAPARSAPAASAGKSYRSPSGISFTLPTGWEAKEGNDGAVLMPPGYVFNPQQMDELYVTGTQEGSATDPSIAAEMQKAFGAQGAQFQQSTMQLGGRPVVAYAASMREPKSGRMMALRIYLVQQGPKVAMTVGLGLADGVERNDAGLRQVAATIAYQAPPAPPPGQLSDGSAAANQWVQRFKGMKLRQLTTGQYEAGSKTWILNADGTFSFASDYSAAVYAPSGANASMANRDGGQGRWRVVGNTLELRFANGNTNTYTLTSNGTQTFMNGVRTYVTGINE